MRATQFVENLGRFLLNFNDLSIFDRFKLNLSENAMRVKFCLSLTI